MYVLHFLVVGDHSWVGGDHPWDGRWPSMEVVIWLSFCELSLSAKFKVCSTLPSGGWPSLGWGWPSMEVVIWLSFFELSLSAKFQVCSTLPSGGWLSSFTIKLANLIYRNYLIILTFKEIISFYKKTIWNIFTKLKVLSEKNSLLL